MVESQGFLGGPRCAELTLSSSSSLLFFSPVCLTFLRMSLFSLKKIIVLYWENNNTYSKYWLNPILISIVNTIQYPITIRSNYRQVVFSITLNFPLVFTQDGLPELGSSFEEIFLVAPFEKNPKLIIFYPILHLDFRGLLENLFR